ncbi:hypothetical protein I4U23_017197 [Adineta vaga]|nr:hypothetical protein I4U23_017197 [Adineta vaga]
MSSSIAAFVANLSAVSFWMNRVVPPLQIIFGTFGNLLNIIIFTRRSLRINPCSTYFLFGSVNNFFAIYVALLTRYLSTSWNLDPSARNTVLCKLRIFFVYVSVCLVLWLTVLASFDRFLSSSYNAGLRRLSRLPIARKIINNNAQNTRLRSSDRQMIAMLLFQVLTTTLFSVPYAAINLYDTVVITMLQYRLSTSGQAIYNVASNLFRLLYYTNPVAGFYIYTLTGPKFRKEMTSCIRYGLKFVLRATHLQGCLPLRIQQALFVETQIGIMDESLTLARRRNTVHPIQHRNPMNRTSII